MRATRSRSISRRTVLAALVGFVLIQGGLLALVCSDGLLRRDNLWQFRVRGYRARMNREPQALSVVQLGTSRTLNGFAGQEGEPLLTERLGQPVVMLNGGVPGCGPLGTLLRLRCMLNDGIRPDLLLLEVFPMGLQEARLDYDLSAENLPASRLSFREAPLLSINSGGQRENARTEWFAEQLPSAMTYRFSFLGFAAPALLPATLEMQPARFVDRSGQFALSLPSPEGASRRRARANTDYNALIENFRLSPRALAAAAETVRVARSAGVRVALVLMPEGPIHRSLYPPGIWEEIRAAVGELAASEGVPLLDMRETMPEDAFVDSHHLHASGAESFTRLLAERVEPILRDIQREKQH